MAYHCLIHTTLLIIFRGMSLNLACFNADGDAATTLKKLHFIPFCENVHSLRLILRLSLNSLMQGAFLPTPAADTRSAPPFFADAS